MSTNPPTISNFSFLAPGGGSGYTLTFTPDVNGNPAPKDPLGSNITSGPYQGFKGIVTEYPITVTARSNSGGSEVRLRRDPEHDRGAGVPVRRVLGNRPDVPGR